MMKKWIWIASISLFAASCGATQSKRSKSAVECSIAQFGGDPGAAKLCQDDCAAGIAEACTSLGSMHSRGHLVPQSRPDALRFWDKACDLQDGLGCFYAGRMRVEDDDQSVRVTSLERACLSDDLTKPDAEFSCYESATAYLNGFGVPVDRARGVQLADAACRAGSFAACDGEFSRPPVYFDSAKTNPSAQKTATDTREPKPGMSLNIRELKADGLMLRNLSCEGIQNGMGAGLLIVGSLSQKKSELEACNATKDVSLAWTVEKSAMTNAEATSEEAEAAACIEKVLAATPMPDGECTATYPAGG